ncbi:MAG: DUF481 domain-containing protein [Pseudomonadota bacterium]
MNHYAFARTILPMILGCLCALAVHGDPGQHGVLEFKDGDRIAGALVSSNDTTGTFHSDRFGTFDFNLAEAHFRPDEVPAKITGFSWAPNAWGISGSYTDSHGKDEQVEFDADAHADWVRERDDFRTSLRAKYKLKDGRVDANEQNLRTRWYHDWSEHWFAAITGYAERDDVKLPLLGTFDYLLLQAGAGFGVRFTGDSFSSRTGIAYNRAYLELLDLHAGVGANAPTLFTENSIALTKRVTLSNWLNLYHWEDDGSTGIDSELELKYSVTKNLSVGLRHRYRDNAVTLQAAHDSEIRVFTSLIFR